MKKVASWGPLRLSAFSIGFSLYWTLLMNQTFYVWYLWRIWWLRPLLMWYSFLIILLVYNNFFFATTMIYCFFTSGRGNSASKALFRRFLCSTLRVFLKILHGLEVHGLRNLPKGGGLIVYFHGPFVPVDICYLFGYVYLKMGRLIGGVIDVNFHRNKFLGRVVEVFEYSSERRKLIEDLKKGELRSVAPGGAYEAMFSKNNELEWQSRIGFAKIAKEAGVPIVPMYTTNLQTATPLASFNQSGTIREWYALTKKAILIPKCYFPVKMRSYLGEPLFCGEDEEPEAFAQRVKKAIENLRDQHEPTPGTVWQGLWERFTWKRDLESDKSE